MRADFAPYRDEIRDCTCLLCGEVACALSDVRDFGGRRHLAACVALLGALMAGEHVRRSYAEMAAEAREAKAVRLAEAEAAGASPATLAAIERGYAKYAGFMVDGIGAGMTPGGVR